MFCFCFLFIYSFIFTLWNQLFQNLLDRSSPHLQDWYLLDDQSEISFSIHQVTLPWQPFVVFIHRPDSLDTDG